MSSGLTRGDEEKGGTSVDDAGRGEDRLVAECDRLVNSDELAGGECARDRAVDHSGKHRRSFASLTMLVRTQSSAEH